MKKHMIKSFLILVFSLRSIFSLEITDIQPREAVPNVTKIHVTTSEWIDKVKFSLIKRDYKKDIKCSSVNSNRNNFTFYIPKDVAPGSYKVECKGYVRDPATGNPDETDDFIVNFQVNPVGGCGYQPVIQELTPEGGGSGSQYITINGNHFCDAREGDGFVNIDGTELLDDDSYLYWTDNLIRVIAPSGLDGSIPVTVTNRIELVSNTMTD